MGQKSDAAKNFHKLPGSTRTNLLGNAGTYKIIFASDCQFPMNTTQFSDFVHGSHDARGGSLKDKTRQKYHDRDEEINRNIYYCIVSYSKDEH